MNIEIIVFYNILKSIIDIRFSLFRLIRSLITSDNLEPRLMRFYTVIIIYFMTISNLKEYET